MRVSFLVSSGKRVVFSTNLSDVGAEGGNRGQRTHLPSKHQRSGYIVGYYIESGNDYHDGEHGAR